MSRLQRDASDSRVKVQIRHDKTSAAPFVSFPGLKSGIELGCQNSLKTKMNWIVGMQLTHKSNAHPLYFNYSLTTKVSRWNEDKEQISVTHLYFHPKKKHEPRIWKHSHSNCPQLSIFLLFLLNLFIDSKNKISKHITPIMCLLLFIFVKKLNCTS